MNNNQNNNNQNSNSNDMYNQNNLNNNNNNFNGNMPNNNINKDKKSKNKLIIIIIIIVVILIFILGFLSPSLLAKNHENTTGLSEYSSEDVDLNCVTNYEKEDGKRTLYSDLMFNYKKGASYNVSQLKTYSKLIIEYNTTLTDEKYHDFVTELSTTECLNEHDCKESHLEFSQTELGWNTVIDRKGNKIIVTFDNIYGVGKTLSSKEMREVKDSYEKDGTKCH